MCACCRGPTFLLVQGRQDAVVPAHLEVDLLLHALGNGTLRDDDADASLDGAQDAAVAVEDAAGGGHHCVALVLVVVLKRARAGGENHRRHQGVVFWIHCLNQTAC